MGTLYTKTGNFTLAENIIKKYVFIAEKQQNQATKISGYINLSIVYKSIGNHQTAIDLLQKASKNKAVSTLQNKKIKDELTVNYLGLKNYKNANSIVQNQTDSEDYQSLKTISFLSTSKQQSFGSTYLLRKSKKFIF